MMAQGYPRESKSLVALYRARIEDGIALYCLLLDAHPTPRIMLSVPSRITQFHSCSSCKSPMPVRRFVLFAFILLSSIALSLPPTCYTSIL